MKIKDPEYRERDNLVVFDRERLSDEEFGDLIRKSLMVLTPYKRETQSSVILVSYMYGTPVVSSDVGGMPEFVSHGKTGYLVSLDSSIEEWIDGIFFVLENIHEMTVNCRDYFVDNSSGRNWRKYLSDLLA
jgi:glycosyltransferase involved in cell wall biosynthesis